MRTEAPVIDSLLNAPDVCWDSRSESTFRSSWSNSDGFLNPEHQQIWQATQAIPGWQHPVDSEKLYEMGYQSGSIILEIGTYAGRSAVVELRGALQAHYQLGRPVPQFYGVDLDPAAISRTYQTLHKTQLVRHCLLYLGDLRGFHRDVPVTPTMVFMDGGHDYASVSSDLQELRTFLAPGTPVLCHDYASEPPLPGVRQAVDEGVASGWYQYMGLFGVSALLRATSRCPGRAQGLARDDFERERTAQLFAHLESLHQANAELQRYVVETQHAGMVLQQQVLEYAASRWRKVGLAMGIVKPTASDEPCGLARWIRHANTNRLQAGPKSRPGTRPSRMPQVSQEEPRCPPR